MLKKLDSEAFKRQEARDYLVAIRLWTKCIDWLVEHPGEEGRIGRAFENGMRCLKHLGANHEVRIKFCAYLHRWQWQQGEFKAGIETLEKIEKIAYGGRLLSDQAEAVDQKGVCLQELGELSGAEAAHKKSLKISRRIGNRESVGMSMNNLGEVYRKTGRFKEAVEAFLEAERIAREAQDYEGEICTAHNRALALEGAGHLDEAEQLLRACRDRSRREKLWGEYVRSWEALANLSWSDENVRTAIRRFHRALAEAKKHKQEELQPEIALNLARLLLSQGRPADGIRALGPYRGDFGGFVRGHEYYGTLGDLYGEVGELGAARQNYELAKKHALRVGQKDRVAYFCGALADIHQKEREPRLSDAELKQAIANEEEPKELAHLLVQRLRLVLDSKRERLAERLFREAKGLIDKHDLRELDVYIHMVLGDYQWKGNYKSKFNAMQAYTAALGKSMLIGEHVVAETVAEVLQQLLGISGGGSERLIDRLEQDVREWLFEQGYGDKCAAEWLLWPLRVARRMLPYRLRPRELEGDVNKIIEEETAAMVGGKLRRG